MSMTNLTKGWSVSPEDSLEEDSKISAERVPYSSNPKKSYFGDDDIITQTDFNEYQQSTEEYDEDTDLPWVDRVQLRIEKDWLDLTVMEMERDALIGRKVNRKSKPGGIMKKAYSVPVDEDSNYFRKDD